MTIKTRTRATALSVALTLAPTVGMFATPTAVAAPTEATQTTTTAAPSTPRTIMWVHDDFFTNLKNATNGHSELQKLVDNLQNDVKKLRTAVDANNTADINTAMKDVQSSLDALERGEFVKQAPTVTISEHDATSLFRSALDPKNTVSEQGKIDAMSTVDGIDAKDKGRLKNQVGEILNAAHPSQRDIALSLGVLAQGPLNTDASERGSVMSRVNSVLDRIKTNRNTTDAVRSALQDGDVSQSDIGTLYDALTEPQKDYTATTTALAPLVQAVTPTASDESTVFTALDERGASQEQINTVIKSLRGGKLTAEKLDAIAKAVDYDYLTIARIYAALLVGKPLPAANVRDAIGKTTSGDNEQRRILSTLTTSGDTVSFTPDTVNMIAGTGEADDISAFTDIMGALSAGEVTLPEARTVEKTLKTVAVSGADRTKIRAALSNNGVTGDKLNTANDLFSKIQLIGLDEEVSKGIVDKLVGGRSDSDAEGFDANTQKTELVESVNKMMESLKQSGVVTGNAKVGNSNTTEKGGKNTDPSTNDKETEKATLANTGALDKGVMPLLAGVVAAAAAAALLGFKRNSKIQ